MDSRNPSMLAGRLAGAAALIVMAVVSTAAFASTPQQQRAEIDQASQQTLQLLYAQQPSARRAIEESAGYAVFSDMSTKIFFAGGGGGRGVAVNRKSGQQTFMMMVSVSAGLGMGISKSHLVWVFSTPEAYQNFVNVGVELGADANLQVNPGQGGGLYDGAVEAAPGAWLYQISDAGLVLELTVQGTKYFKDPDLN